MLKFLVLLQLLLHVTSGQKIYRVVNGVPVGYIRNNSIVNTGQFPFVVLLRLVTIPPNIFSRCGGNILKPNYIVTAAHCVINRKVESMTVYGGFVHISFKENELQVLSVEKYIVHENFSKAYEPFQHDIAIVKLNGSFRINYYVKPINLPISKYYTPDLQGIALGWGIKENGKFSSWLLKTNLRIISNNECQMLADIIAQKFNHQIQNITKEMFCAFNKNKSTVCNGDSGGPLVHNGALIGILNWGWSKIGIKNSKVTCNTDFPAVFIRVASYLDWIKENTID